MQPNPNTHHPSHKDVTVEEIDQTMHSIAASCRFSSSAIYTPGSTLSSSSSSRPTTDGTVGAVVVGSAEESLGALFRRLSARDAKWLARLVLKNYEPVVLNPATVYRALHPSLPLILQVQDDFGVAARVLADLRRNRSVVAAAGDETSLLAHYLRPKLGIKVGRQPWIKARSIKHCLDMSHGRMSCE